jgi:hypothetical protein
MRSILLLAVAVCALRADDAILKAIDVELERSRTLKIAQLEPPYFVNYTVNDTEGFVVNASLGAVVNKGETRIRVPQVEVRVGDYEFDNTNYIASDYFAGSRYDTDQLPIDDDPLALRRAFWLATDREYKTAAEAIGRKRAALKNVTQMDQLPDLWKAQPVKMILPERRFKVDRDAWVSRIRNLSAAFLNYPEVLSSSVHFGYNTGNRYTVNTEGTRIRVPESITTLTIRAEAFTPDGTPVRDTVALHAEDPSTLPSDEKLRAAIAKAAENVKALAKAAPGEAYAGPVLFEGQAGAQMLADLLGSELGATRRPVGEPNRPLPFRPSELEARVGLRVLPEFMTVVDDPTLTEFSGERLYGGYEVDEEGVVPKPLTLVNKGVLEKLLTTRQPVNQFTESSGRARLPGIFGARSSSYSNLIISTSEGVPASELKKKLLQMCAARQRPYGLVVRKMDYPSSGSMDEIRRLAANAPQSGATRVMSSPALVYRVYPDGREELIRGLQFRNASVRLLRDIAGASTERYVFQFLRTLAPLSLMGTGGFVAPSAVIAPALLFEELELYKPQEDQPKLPTVPPPELAAAAR